ncbi:MAG: mitochondrial fission ELM1 family protein [Verrucomicrobia bacterium]|jgi:mitochondrial fission protein ELM1|nr:mitochondrial fission ELM1 family protein [Verrucomicrobiota bacterium]
MPDPRTEIHIWRFMDGKPGHENQTLGLIRALEKRVPCSIKEWKVPNGWLPRLRWRRAWSREVVIANRPDLILGAGHLTHTMLLRARRKFGGRSILMMQPSLPAAWFDLCVVPEHDGVRDRKGIMQVRGVLNPVERSANQSASQGLILVGGPCRHVHWNDPAIVEQIHGILQSTRNTQWTLTTSRRTPDTFLDLLRPADNLSVIPAAETPSGWVAAQLARCGQVWASGDSVSMLYESLTSGAATGMLEVDWAGEGKLRQGVKSLIQSGMITSFANWKLGEPLAPPSSPLAESQRVADWVLDHWFPNVGGLPSSPLNEGFPE